MGADPREQDGSGSEDRPGTAGEPHGDGAAEQFRDSEIGGDEELHASFERLDKPSPDTDPFAGRNDEQGDDEQGDDEQGSRPGGATDDPGRAGGS